LKIGQHLTLSSQRYRIFGAWMKRRWRKKNKTRKKNMIYIYIYKCSCFVGHYSIVIIKMHYNVLFFYARHIWKWHEYLSFIKDDMWILFFMNSKKRMQKKKKSETIMQLIIKLQQKNYNKIWRNSECTWESKLLWPFLCFVFFFILFCHIRMQHNSMQVLLKLSINEPFHN